MNAHLQRTATGGAAFGVLLAALVLSGCGSAKHRHGALAANQRANHAAAREAVRQRAAVRRERRQATGKGTGAAKGGQTNAVGRSGANRKPPGSSPGRGNGTSDGTRTAQPKTGQQGGSESHSHNTGSRYPATVQQAINTFVGCMREHGVPMQSPNFSAPPNEILSDKGINVHSATFQSALQACGADLIAVLRAGGAQLVTPTP